MVAEVWYRCRMWLRSLDPAVVTCSSMMAILSDTRPLMTRKKNECIQPTSTSNQLQAPGYYGLILIETSRAKSPVRSLVPPRTSLAVVIAGEQTRSLSHDTNCFSLTRSVQRCGTRTHPNLDLAALTYTVKPASSGMSRVIQRAQALATEAVRNSATNTIS